MPKLTIRPALIAAFVTIATLPPTVAGAGDGPAIFCGDVLGPGVHTLTANFGPCDTSTGPYALTINSAVLNLNNFDVVCSDINPADGTVPSGILVSGKSATLMNGRIVGCEEGVRLTGEGSHRVDDIEVRDGESRGFVVDSGCDKNTLFECAAVDLGSTGYDIASDKNKILSSFVDNSGGGAHGFHVSGSKNKLFDTHAFSVDVGFYLGGEKNTLSESVSIYNFRGVTLDGNRHKVVASDITVNSGDGIRVNHPGAKVLKNTISGNQGDGINVDAAAEGKVTIIGNNASGNALSYGWDLEDSELNCGDNVWKKNTYATKSQPCIQ